MDATIIVEEWAVPVLSLTVGLFLVSAIIGVIEFREWQSRRKLEAIITEDQQPAHPPTQPVPIQITKVSDRRRRTAGLAIIPPPEADLGIIEEE